eukprot:scaffold30946_cov90-Isochrysis_galbana.AAC.1
MLATCLQVLSAVAPLPQLGDAVLPLAGKRVLVASPRVHAAPLTAALVDAGARPLWWPLVEVVPLQEGELEALDEVIMRLPEYTAVTFLSRHAVRLPPPARLPRRPPSNQPAAHFWHLPPAGGWLCRARAAHLRR